MPIRKTDGSAKPERRIDAPESIIANSSVDNITAGTPADMVMMTITLFPLHTPHALIHSLNTRLWASCIEVCVCFFLWMPSHKAIPYTRSR